MSFLPVPIPLTLSQNPPPPTPSNRRTPREGHLVLYQLQQGSNRSEPHASYRAVPDILPSSSCNLTPCNWQDFLAIFVVLSVSITLEIASLVLS